MADQSDPPRKIYGLKPREFERVNEPPRKASAAPAVPGESAAPAPIAGNDVHEFIRQAHASRPPPVGAAPANRENEIHALLRDNHQRAEAVGLNQVALPARRFRRRRRDFWILLVGGNAFLGGIYAAELFLGFQVQCLAARMPGEFGNLVDFALHHPAAYALTGVGMVFFSGCLAWLMFGVMENY